MFQGLLRRELCARGGSHPHVGAVPENRSGLGRLRNGGDFLKSEAAFLEKRDPDG